MQWEKLTYPDFKKAVKDSKKVCILPIGVIEKHSDHLPLGTDLLIAHTIASLAAKKEKAVVFPYYYFSQIYEARHKAGTISIKPKLLLALLENVCDEIGRNGFEKIILLSGHGGNPAMLQYFVQTMLAEKKEYILYYPKEFYHEAKKVRGTVLVTTEDGHAGESETSSMLALYEELVKKSCIQSKPGSSLKRLQHLPGFITPVNWYADYPAHYCGDAGKGTRAKGEVLSKMYIDYVVKVIQLVKKDKAVKKLYNEFFKACTHKF